MICARSPAPRFRHRTGTSPTIRSIGAGRISTSTIALRGCVSRSDESATPTVTVSRTRSRLPVTVTGSVIASASRRTRLSGPRISTVAGSLVMRPTTNPGAGSPSSGGTTGTIRLADFSSSIASVPGTTCATSTPYGARTSSARM